MFRKRSPKLGDWEIKEVRPNEWHYRYAINPNHWSYWMTDAYHQNDAETRAKNFARMAADQYNHTPKTITGNVLENNNDTPTTT